MGDNVTTVAPGGRTLPRTAEDAAALGATVQDPAIGEAEAVVQRQRKMFERPIDKALAFTEGVIDAATLGLVHGHDADSAMNRDVNSGYNFAGEAVGTALGLVTGGPVRGVAGLGERAGVAAAKGVLRQGEKAIVTTALREAGAGAALTGATAFGHQLIDAVIEDRAFSGEAVLDATKLGGIIGLAGGGLMGGFGKLATRADVKLQGGLVGDLGDALGTHESASAAYGEALHFHEQQLGALKQLRKAGALGDVSDDFLRVRSATIKEARAAQQALRDLDVEAALSGKDPAAYKNFQRRWSEYTRAMEQVDEIMTPHPAELVGARRLGAEAGPAGETSVSQTSSATPADMAGTQVRSVRGSEDFIVPASRVSEAIPDEAGYLANYKSRPMESVEGAPAQMPEGTPAGTVPGKKTAMPPPNDLALLDEAIKKLPMRTGEENGAVFASALDGPTQLESVPYGQVAKQMDAADAAAATAVRPGPIEKPMPADVTNRLMDSWVQLGEPRIRPWREAQTRAQAAMEAFYAKSGGRLDSARGLGILEADGIRASTDQVGSYMDSVYAMNRAARFVTDEARGVATPLRKAGKNAIMGLLGAKMLGMSGGMSALMGFMSYGGRMAAATGRLYRNIVESVASFMTSTQVRSLAVAAGNQPWAYSERGPIKDPVERIREIQFLAQNPDSIRAKVRQQAGDLFAAAPEHVMALEERAVGQIQSLAIRAPAIYWDRLGRPLSPPQGKLRAFYEFENATNDLGMVLRALRTGGLTQPQVDALSISWPAVHTRIIQGMLAEPEKLMKFDRAKLRTIEMVTGMALTGAADPMFMARQQQGWIPPTPQAPPGRPQAFNINPDGAPTPSQANATGRAPGN